MLPLIIMLATFLCSCAQEEAALYALEEGTYRGSFYRSSPSATYETSDVSITFRKNRFEGSSSVAKYPAICSGTYMVQGQEIEFVNECFWTAEFDWSYILSGKFTLTYEGDQMILSRSYGEGVTDTYILKKE